MNTSCYSPHVTSSLMRGWVCRLQLLLAFASSVILRSESHGTHDHIFLSQIRDSPNLQGQIPVCIPQEHGGPVIPLGTEFFFFASYDSQGYGGDIRPSLHVGEVLGRTNSLLSFDKNDAHKNSSIVSCVFVAAGMYVLSSCLATVGGYTDIQHLLQK
jgi:hypothetical protein